MTRRSHLNGLHSPYLVRAALRARDAMVAQMADDFRTLHTRTGCVVADDLELLGWTPQQINSCGADARRRALRESIRDVRRIAA